jgi:hypothetical protein
MSPPQRLCFRELHERHKTWMLCISSVPPRERGTIWSAVRSKIDPHLAQNGLAALAARLLTAHAAEYLSAALCSQQKGSPSGTSRRQRRHIDRGKTKPLTAGG